MKKLINAKTYTYMLAASVTGFWFLSDMQIEEVLYMAFCTATAAFAIMMFASDIIKEIKRTHRQREIYRRWKRKKERLEKMEREWPMYEQDINTGEIGKRVC